MKTETFYFLMEGADYVCCVMSPYHKNRGFSLVSADADTDAVLENLMRFKTAEEATLFWHHHWEHFNGHVKTVVRKIEIKTTLLPDIKEL